MTPVQLPEVPEPEKRAFYVCTKCGFMGNDGPVHNEPYGLAKSECGYLAVTDGDLYTAAQLRAYATEAVMAERARLRTAVADYMHSEGCSCCRDDDHEEHEAVIAGLLGVAPYSDNSGFDFAPYRTGATQPEQNSGR